MNQRAGAPQETIAAIATAPGRGGLGVIRVSGNRVPLLAEELLGQLPPPRHAVYQNFRAENGEFLDSGIALYFPEPHSFTGEHVLELQGHGGPVVLDLVLARILSLRVRAARPGEFSERAFLNGKLDLTQAEAIADLIDSATSEAARSAHRSLQGAFSVQIQLLVSELAELRTFVEAAIDFAEDEVDFLSDAQIDHHLSKLALRLEQVLDRAYQGTLLRDGMHVVIAGRPNVGKSSLLNALAGRDCAIVTDVPGTTRDALKEQIQIDGLPVHITDTAGLRDTDDPVEQIGVRRAWETIAGADALLLVLDDQLGLGPADQAILDRLPDEPERILVYNKIDLTGRSPGIGREANAEAVQLSAATGAGIQLLAEHLKGLMGYSAGESTFTARRRHLDALRRTRAWLGEARKHLSKTRARELLAEDLRQAQQCLGEITGEVTTEELLDRIFASFCIGK